MAHERITRIISKQLDIKLGPFTQEKLDSVRRKNENRKAVGLDEIPPEVWKTRQFDDILPQHCNAVYNQNPIDRWTKGCILPIPVYHYLLRTTIYKLKENGFKLTKERSGKHPAQIIIDADSADDITLLASAPTQVEIVLHSLERAAAGISLHVNTHKTEYRCFNQTGDISTLNGSSLKLVDKFTYLGSSYSSTETDINTQLAKAWTVTDRLSIMWKSDRTNKMKRSFFQAAVVSILLYGCTTLTLTKQMEEKLDGNYTRILPAILNKSWRQHPR